LFQNGVVWVSSKIGKSTKVKVGGPSQTRREGVRGKLKINRVTLGPERFYKAEMWGTSPGDEFRAGEEDNNATEETGYWVTAQLSRGTYVGKGQPEAGARKTREE